MKSNTILRQIVIDDFSIILKRIGVPDVEVEILLKKFLDLLDENITQATFEEEFHKLIFSLEIGPNSFQKIFDDSQKKRSERTYSNIVDFIDSKNKILDFGCGNGLIGNLLLNRKELSVEGCDVVVYAAEDIKIPIHKFDGYHLDVSDGYFEIGYANHVLHHDKEPRKVIAEISRVVSKKFILLEDTLQGNTIEEKDLQSKRLFINDYIYNRLLIDSNIPMPGTNMTADGWIETFQSFGWKLSGHDKLGWSKTLPAVFIERFIFEKI